MGDFDRSYFDRCRLKGLIPRIGDPADEPAEFEAMMKDISEGDEVKNYVDKCNKITDMIEEIDKPNNDFLNDVYEKVESVADTISQTNRVSDRQKSAINNWHDAVEKIFDRN